MRWLHDEKGFSTAGTAIALLLTLSLVFSMGRVYRVSSDAAAIQDAADAAALAAQNEVAEFMVAVRVCDAIALTLSLTGFGLMGAGIVALCVPSGGSVAMKLIDAADRILDARDEFSRYAFRALTNMAKALPFLSAANALSVARDNDGAAGSGSGSGSDSGSGCLALAVLVPSEVGNSSSMDEMLAVQERDGAVGRAVRENADELQQSAQRAEQAAQTAQVVKEKAYLADCGSYPSYCMCERAESLGGLSASGNPRFSSVDAWSFSVALDRARAYYASRLANEEPHDGSIEECARSALRRNYYAYAVDELANAYVVDDGERFEAYFPIMPCNTEEMRGTALYVDGSYPISVDSSGNRIMHAWDGCPQARVVGSYGSVALMEQGGFPVCPSCGFTAESLGRVAAATGSVESGFEFHYNEVAAAVAAYEEARSVSDGWAIEVRMSAQTLFDSVSEAMQRAARCRIDIAPPGSQGVIVLAVDPGDSEVRGFETSFVRDAGALGARAAVSAATMVEEKSQEGRTVITSILDGLVPRGSVLPGVGEMVLTCWSFLLQSYGNGQEAVGNALESVFDGFSLRSSSGLGTWARDAFERCVEAMGLQPAELNSLKPVLVNSGYVASRGDDAFCVRYSQIKEAALRMSGPSSSLFSSAVSALEGYAVGEVELADGGVELAVLDVPELGISIPLTIEVPDAATELTIDFIHEAAFAIQSLYAQVAEVRIWE